MRFAANLAQRLPREGRVEHAGGACSAENADCTDACPGSVFPRALHSITGIEQGPLRAVNRGDFELLVVGPRRITDVERP